MNRCCIIAFFFVGMIYTTATVSQEIDEQLDLTLPVHKVEEASISPVDTLPLPKPPADTLSFSKWKYLIHTIAYRRKKKHPYFRDEIRVMYDLRRLVRFIEPRGRHNYESIPDLVNIANEMPLEKQASIIGTAFVGGTAYILSDMTNRQLRKRKLGFLRWRLDQVEVQRRFRRYFSLRLYSGVRGTGAQFYVPFARTMYAWRSYATYAFHGLTYRLTNKFAIGYQQGENRQVFTCIIIPARGYRAQASYNRNRQYINSYIELRRFNFFILRLICGKYLKRQRSESFRGEVLWQL